jgi:hypothetical protein
MKPTLTFCPSDRLHNGRLAVLRVALGWLALSLGVLALAATGWAAGKAQHDLTLTPLGTYATGNYEGGAATILAHDPLTQRVFVVNTVDHCLEVLDISDPTSPVKVGAISIPEGTPNSVAVRDGVVAVAANAALKTDLGTVRFYDAGTLGWLSSVTVGSLPDMLTFTPNGQRVLVANEGEPNDDYTVDPPGTLSLIDLTGGAAQVTQADVVTVDFTAFDGATLDPSIRIFGPGATVSQDLEPEYIAVSHDSKTAWVTLQENNAVATIDLDTATVMSLTGLGFKDHSLSGNALDASDKDGIINIANWPLKGMYQPDGLAALRCQGQDFLVLANEGDSRDYDGFSEVGRVKDLNLSEELRACSGTKKLGRLQVTTENGYTIGPEGERLYTELYAYGARSVSIRTGAGELIWDSGDDFEALTAAAYPNYFNAGFDTDALDDRSDNKGPEPEGVVVEQLFGRVYAFVGLERIGGIMVYDLTNPYSPRFVDYVNTRVFTGLPDFDFTTAGDLGPEGLIVIKEEDSPTGEPLLAVAYEPSGTTTFYRISLAP